MAEKVQKEDYKKTIEKSRSRGGLDFENLYDQIIGENATLQANKKFWTRKGNSVKYTCTLCNIGVQVSSNLSVFKSAILAHLEEKYHKKRYDSFIVKESTIASPADNKMSIDKYCEQQNLEVVEDDRSILDILNQEEAELMGLVHELEVDHKSDSDTSLVDFNSIYNSFEKSNPVVKASKQFIVKTGNGRDFYCTLCKVLILNSLNATEFRFDLWVHLNEESHRERLPNYAEVKEEFEKTMEKMSESLSGYYKFDLRFFTAGPVFRFVTCTLCNVAVSTNAYRFENHLKENDHVKKKHLMLRGEPMEFESSNTSTLNAFRKLVVKLDDRFKKDIKYIKMGKIPGYIVCSLCTYIVLPTKFYVESHLESAAHAKNKTTNIVSRNSKFKISLRDLMKTLPDDLKDYTIFEETACGLKCKRCNVTIPPTSYELYTHINKERLSCVST